MLKFGWTKAKSIAVLAQFLAWQNKQYSKKYGFPKPNVMLRDSVLGGSVYEWSQKCEYLLEW